MSAVMRDEVRGHFALKLPATKWHEREVMGVDLGPTLHLTMQGAHLTPDEARTLAETLVWWADRKHDAEEHREIELHDLFDLLEESRAEQAAS